jgi:hypothetical protein
MIQHFIRPAKSNGFIILDYYAELEELRLTDEIDYNLECYGSDEILRQSNMQMLCYKQCVKIGFYINELYGLVWTIN